VSKVNFLTYEQCAERFRGKSVAIIGSGPSAFQNSGAHIDSHDVIVRIQNYKMRKFEKLVGSRTDVVHSFWGISMRKTATELAQDGVTLCMCKCHDGSLPFKCEWHEKSGKIHGVNYRYIYNLRAQFWFCDVYAPKVDRFMDYFSRIKNQDSRYPGHQPTTGMACLYDFMGFECSKVYVTGFDFFTSRIHNGNEAWSPQNSDDPIRHMPEKEMAWLKENWPKNWYADKRLSELIGAPREVV